jgi:hypothetical protein
MAPVSASPVRAASGAPRRPLRETRRPGPRFAGRRDGDEYERDRPRRGPEVAVEVVRDAKTMTIDVTPSERASG